VSEHNFIDAGPLTEPGISDIDGGQWARRRVVCTRCGEHRDIWKDLALTDSRLTYGCPGRRR
jgi:hypothetical protein